VGLGPTTPPFTQCPGVGADTSCAVLIIFNPDGTVTVKNDPSQGPFDSIEDTLVGVQNNLSSPVFSISISGNSIFTLMAMVFVAILHVLGLTQLDMRAQA